MAVLQTGEYVRDEKRPPKDHELTYAMYAPQYSVNLWERRTKWVLMGVVSEDTVYVVSLNPRFTLKFRRFR